MTIRNRLAVAFSVTAGFLLAVGVAAVLLINQLSKVLEDSRYCSRQWDMVAEAMVELHHAPQALAQHVARLNDLERWAHTEPEKALAREARSQLATKKSVPGARAVLDE